MGMDEAHHGGSAYPDFVKKRGAPTQDVVIVMTDVEAPRVLWKNDPALMIHCQTLHDNIIRGCIADNDGYEVLVEGDNFTIAFHNCEDALNFGFTVQYRLLQTQWPAELLSHPKCALVFAQDIHKDAARAAKSMSSSTKSKSRRRKKKSRSQETPAKGSSVQPTQGGKTKKGSRQLFNGLRVRMAMDYGYCSHSVNEVTEKYSYTGAPMNHCKTVLKCMQSGGQIIFTKAMNKALVDADDAFQDRYERMRSEVTKQRSTANTPATRFARRLHRSNVIHISSFALRFARCSHKISLGTHLFQDLQEELELIQCLPQDLSQRELLPIISVRMTAPDYSSAPSANIKPGFPVPPVTLVTTKFDEVPMRGVRAAMVHRVYRLHAIVMRKFLADNKGYECDSEGGNFVLAFPTVANACNWAIASQLALDHVDWRNEPKQVGDAMMAMQMRAAIHSDLIDYVEPNSTNGRAAYYGAIIDVSDKCSDKLDYGVLLTERAYMMLPPGHNLVLNVGDSLKLTTGRGTTQINTYRLALPDEDADPQEYKFTKYRHFEIKSEGAEKQEAVKRAQLAKREKHILKRQTHHREKSKAVNQNDPIAVLNDANLGAWKLEDTEMDFEAGFFVSSGSFGEVRTAIFRGTMVAVKSLKKEQVTVENMKRFKDELLLCRDLRHPNVMQVLGGCWNTLDNVFIVMEYCEKGSLASVLKREGGQYNVVTTKLGWITEIAMAMCYLHGFNPPIVHRDLKGDNVLINQSMNCKLCDFGESRQKTDDATMTTVGSPFWIAPEVFTGEHYDETCDVYSFGLCILEILCNSHMESAFNYSLKGPKKRFGLAIVHKVAKGWRPALDEAWLASYPNLVQLMRDCWEQDARRRPNFARILKYLTELRRRVDPSKDKEIEDIDSSLLRGASTSSGSSESSDRSNKSTPSSTLRGGSSSTSTSATSSLASPRNSFRGSFRGEPTMPSLREEIKDRSGDCSSSSYSGSVDSGTGEGSDSTSLRASSRSEGNTTSDAGSNTFRDEADGKESGTGSQLETPRPLKRDTSSDAAMRILMGSMEFGAD